MELNRYDIVGINLNPKKGDELGKIRPCIILSDNDSNSVLDTIIVVPLSTHLIDDMQPYRKRLKKRSGLKNDSDALLNHIRTISKKRVTSKIATITQEEYISIKTYICEIL
jgi:mRNA interferase MazF